MPAPRNTPKAEVLRGLVDRVVFHNEDNGYCILKIVPEGRRDVVSLIESPYAPSAVRASRRMVLMS